MENLDEYAYYSLIYSNYCMHLSALETIGVVNLCEYLGSKVKCQM